MDYDVLFGDAVSNTPIVPLESAKHNSNIDYDDDDVYLQGLLIHSIAEAETYINTPLQQREVVISLTAWPKILEIPLANMVSLDSITYAISATETATLDPLLYVKYTTSEGDKIKFKDGLPALSEDVGFPIKVNVIAGYNEQSLPSAIARAIILRFSQNEKYREGVPTSMNKVFERALRPFKIWC